MDTKREDEISDLPRHIISGAFDLSGNGLVVGRQFAEAMGLSVGDGLSIYSVQELKKMHQSLKKRGPGSEGQEVIVPSEYEVRGIFEVGYFDYDYKVIVCSVANAQDLFGLGDGVMGLTVMLYDPFNASSVATRLKVELGPHYEVRTWEQDNAGMLDALLVEKNVMFYILFFIMIVAAFGITSALITFVVQKTREIGVLKALGSTNSQIVWIFLSQSLFVGVMGVLAGFGLGMLAVSYRNDFLFFLRRVTGFELFPARIYMFSELPALLDARDITLICGGSLIICLLAGIFPAWNAGRLKPVEALRHE
jgi:lipoprotein-releasing system permease protein